MDVYSQFDFLNIMFSDFLWFTDGLVKVFSYNFVHKTRMYCKSNGFNNFYNY